MIRINNSSPFQPNFLRFPLLHNCVQLHTACGMTKIYWHFMPKRRIQHGDGVSLKTPRPRGWVGAGRPSGCKSSFNKRNMYQYPHVSQLFILLPWQSRVYPEPLKVVEFVQLTTECCWGQPSDPCQRGCLTSHACVMWGPRTLNADDDDDDVDPTHLFRFSPLVYVKGLEYTIG